MSQMSEMESFKVKVEGGTIECVDRQYLWCGAPLVGLVFVYERHCQEFNSSIFEIIVWIVKKNASDLKTYFFILVILFLIQDSKPVC